MKKNSIHVWWAVAFVSSMTSLNASGQNLPVSATPDWRPVSSSNGNVIEFERSGYYVKGEYTYVAVRELEKSDPSAYVFVVHAFNCSKQRVSTAMLGRMSKDGSNIDSGRMNPEKLLEKYSDSLPVPKFEHLTEIGTVVCSRRK